MKRAVIPEKDDRKCGDYATYADECCVYKAMILENNCNEDEIKYYIEISRFIKGHAIFGFGCGARLRISKLRSPDKFMGDWFMN